MFSSRNLGNVGYPIAKGCGWEGTAKAFLLSFVKTQRKTVQCCLFASWGYIVNHNMSDHFNQSLAECVKYLHLCSTKYATVRISHFHMMKCIVQSML